MARGKNRKLKERRLIEEIMIRESPQRKVDEIVENTKKAMEICIKESQQAKVDKIVEEELSKMEM